jgi:MinD-like ATPase involved in chromosome partitioning or flagellar assembly
MTVTITFNEDDGADAVQDALNGWRYRAAYERVQEQLRGILKYDTHPGLDADTVEFIKVLMHDEHPFTL